jgi:soluble lytic murein transglycosylase-like protein
MKIKIRIAIVVLSILVSFWLFQTITTGFASAVNLVEPHILRYEMGKWQKVGINIQHKNLWDYPVETQIRKVFGKDAKLAEAIFRAESGLNCNAVSYTGDIGIAQINAKFHAKRALANGMNGNLMDCTTNLLVAKQIFDEQGWTPWVVYNTLAYKKFLK